MQQKRRHTDFTRLQNIEFHIISIGTLLNLKILTSQPHGHFSPLSKSFNHENMMNLIKTSQYIILYTLRTQLGELSQLRFFTMSLPFTIPHLAGRKAPLITTP